MHVWLFNNVITNNTSFYYYFPNLLFQNAQMARLGGTVWVHVRKIFTENFVYRNVIAKKTSCVIPYTDAKVFNVLHIYSYWQKKVNVLCVFYLSALKLVFNGDTCIYKLYYYVVFGLLTLISKKLSMFNDCIHYEFEKHHCDVCFHFSLPN